MKKRVIKLRDSDYLISKFKQAAELLPDKFKQAAYTLDLNDRENAEEFRMRAEKIFTVLLPGGEKSLDVTAGQADISDFLEMATNSSMHASIESIKAGFITAAGGHRIGLCGTAVMKDGEISNIKDISSVCIRISKEMKGVADDISNELVENGEFLNTIIISPPGMGKTTLLRDIIRSMGKRFRVSVADERGEIAAVRGGVPQYDLGAMTDVMSGCPKAAAMMLLLRVMSPQIIAADEITAPEDITAMESAVNCGVKLLATAHANDKNDLVTRPMYRRMLDLNIFKKFVTIRINDGKRMFSAEDLR